MFKSNDVRVEDSFRRSPNRPRARLARLLFAAAVLSSLGGCVLDHGFLAAAGPVADQTRSLFFLVCLILLFVLTPVFVLTPIVVWHYRLANTKSAYRPDWGFNWPLEALIWIPPVIIVVTLGVFLWRDTHLLDPYKSLPSAQAPTEVQAVALDWKWLFIYPKEGVATVNQLVFPADRPIHLSMTSATVMQSFFVPNLGGQINVMAGMTTQHNLAANAPGNFWGENTQFNGMGFQNQKFEVLAKPSDAYRRWIASTKVSGITLDMKAYKSLTVRQTSPEPIQFGSVAPNLFLTILNQDVTGANNADVSAAHGHHER